MIINNANNLDWTYFKCKVSSDIWVPNDKNYAETIFE